MTNHDAFVVHAVADSDTSDVLAALGVNALFTGTPHQVNLLLNQRAVA